MATWQSQPPSAPRRFCGWRVSTGLSAGPSERSTRTQPRGYWNVIPRSREQRFGQRSPAERSMKSGASSLPIAPRRLRKAAPADGRHSSISVPPDSRRQASGVKTRWRSRAHFWTPAPIQTSITTVATMTFTTPRSRASSGGARSRRPCIPRRASSRRYCLPAARSRTTCSSSTTRSPAMRPSGISPTTISSGCWT